MNLFEVNRQTCNRDGICAAVCPAGIIDFQKGEFPAPAADAEEVCIVCGHCVAVCPTGSLSHRDVPLEQCPPVREDLRLSAEHCEHFLRSRRSIRTYKDEPVSREAITRLIEIARYAPSGHNSQCVEWLVLSDRQALRELAGVVIDWMRWVIGQAPELAQKFRLPRAVSRWEEGYDVILRDAPVVIVAHAEKDNRLAPAACTIALTYLELAAPSMGLGACWAGYFHAAATTFPSMAAALVLPEGHQSFGAMMVGHPQCGYHRLPPRRPPLIAWR